MNKTVLKLISVAALAAAIAACNGGGGSSSSSPSQATASQVAVPGTTVSGSTVNYSVESGNYTFYVPNGTTYTTLTPIALPSIPTSVAIQGSNLVITTASGSTTTIWVGNSSSAATTLTLESVSFESVTPTIASGNTYTFIGTSTSGSAYTGASGGVITNVFPNGTQATLAGFAESCASVNSSTAVTALSAVSITSTGNSGSYLGVGGNLGDVCLYGTSGTESGNWLDMTTSAKNHGYSTTSAVGGIAFSPIGGGGTSSNYSGTWYNANGTIWQVVAPSTVTTCTGNSSCTFAQVNSSTSTGTSFTAGSIYSIIANPNNGNVYVGGTSGSTYGGKVWKLQNNFAGASAAWTSVQLQTSSGTNESGNVSLGLTTTGSVVAQDSISGNIYNVQ